MFPIAWRRPTVDYGWWHFERYAESHIHIMSYDGWVQRNVKIEEFTPNCGRRYFPLIQVNDSFSLLLFHWKCFQAKFHFKWWRTCCQYIIDILIGFGWCNTDWRWWYTRCFSGISKSLRSYVDFNVSCTKVTSNFLERIILFHKLWKSSLTPFKLITNIKVFPI